MTESRRRMTEVMAAPIIGISAWTHHFDTVLGDDERHYSIAAGYVAGIADAGGIPIVLPTISPEFAADTVARIDGLVISGGADIDPARYGASNTRSVEIDSERDAFGKDVERRSAEHYLLWLIGMLGVAALAISSAIKLYPALLLPALLNHGQRIKGSLTFVVTMLLLYLPFLAAGRKVLGFLPIYLQNPYESFNLGLKYLMMQLLPHSKSRPGN